VGKNTSASLGFTAPGDPHHQQLSAVKMAPHSSHMRRISRRRTPSHPPLFSAASCLIARPCPTCFTLLPIRHIVFSGWRDGPAANRPPPLT
jgi:hypothetical protein